jgi:predicted ATPase
MEFDVIDIESCIDGLWFAPEVQGYLCNWFPMYRKPEDGYFVPLKPGLNVVYGRNGAGKSQLLNAIAYATEFRMSSHDGFVVTNPRLESPSNGMDPEIFSASADDVLNGYCETWTEDMDLGEYPGFVPRTITAENREMVLAIIDEFLRTRRCLLTRAPVFGWPEIGDPETMNPPQDLQLVPMLLPSDEAPISRSHAELIEQDYKALLEKIRESDAASLDRSESVELQNEYYEKVRKEGSEEMAKLFAKWSWSPLVNLRNLGFLSGINYEFDSNPMLARVETSPLFLPAFFTEDVRSEYVEFGKPPFFGRQNLSLTVEELNAEDQNLAVIDREAIGFPWVSGKSSSEENDALRESLLMEYVRRLSEKLHFLPSLQGLRYSVFKSNSEKASSPHMSLQLSNRVSVSRGSSAERRWIRLAKAAVKETTQWIVIDEPESGLHRTAEAELAQRLSSPSWSSSSVVVVATHSPEFLDLPNAHVLHADFGTIREFTSFNREELASLGLRPGDLLTHLNTFLLVEGEHERIIFESLFADELRRLQCKIIVARGAKNMKDIFESQVIFDFTDAKIVSLLDNTEADRVVEIWSEARKLAAIGKVIESGEYLRTALPKSKSGENIFLSQFLTSALTHGQHERVEVWGLSKPDIVLYLPPENFGIKRTWEELLSEHGPSDPSFKTWATKKYGADFSVETIHKAVKTLDHVPDEFGDLMLRIAEVCKRSE